MSRGARFVGRSVVVSLDFAIPVLSLGRARRCAPRLDLGVNLQFCFRRIHPKRGSPPCQRFPPTQKPSGTGSEKHCTACMHAIRTPNTHAQSANSPKIYLDCAFENRHTNLEARSSTTTTPHDQRSQYIVDLCCSSISASSIRRYRKKIWNLPVRWARTRMIRIWSNDSICHSPYT